MDKKTIYYIVAGVVLVTVVGIIIMMQNSGNVIPGPDGNPPAAKQPVKSEVEVNKDVAKKLNLSDGELPLRLTMDDNGQSSSLTPGKNIALMLGTDYDWTISTSDDKVLAERTVALDDARVQAVYQVVGEGAAVLSAQGKCKNKSSCAGAAAQFSFSVEGVISENVLPEDLVK